MECFDRPSSKEALLLKGRDGGLLGVLRGDEPNNPFVALAMKVLSEVQSAPSRAIRHKALFGLVGLGPGQRLQEMISSWGFAGRRSAESSAVQRAKEVADRRTAMIPWAKEKKVSGRDEQNQ